MLVIIDVIFSDSFKNKRFKCIWLDNTSISRRWASNKEKC